MVAVVADAGTIVEVLSQHGRIGAYAYTVIMLRDFTVSIVQQGVADVFNMLIVGLSTVVSAAGSFAGANADAFVQPVGLGGDVAFVVDHFRDLVLHIGHSLGRETAYKHLWVIVVAFELAKPDVGSAAAHRLGCEVGIVAHQEHITEVLVGVVVAVEDIRLDEVGVVASYLGETDHRGRPSRHVLPVDKRLHGVQETVGTNDQKTTFVGDEGVFGCFVAIVDETVGVHGLCLG